MGKILELRVEWHEGAMNRPAFEALFDEIPDSSLRYWKAIRGQSHYFLAVQQDFANWMAWVPGDTTGFSGRDFRLLLRSGEVVTLKGPWSSDSDIISSVFSGKLLQHGGGVIECAVTSSEQVWTDLFGVLASAGATHLGIIDQAIRQGMKIGLVESSGRIRLEPLRNNGKPKDGGTLVERIRREVA